MTNGSPTYVPLSRGLDDHLASIYGTALKVYLHLLINAVYHGPQKGQCARSFREIATHLGLSYESVRRAVAELTPHYLNYDAAKNQHSVTVFTIQKYKTAFDFAPHKSAGSKSAGSSDGADELLPSPATEQTSCFPRQRRSNPSKQQKQKGLQTPKKKKKEEGEGDGNGAKNAPPAFVCSHQDCSNPPYHAGRIVAESQGLEFPGDVGNLARWLRDSKDLTKYADSDLVEFVAHKVRKDSPKWDDQKLRPNFVAEDIGAYLRKRSASAANTEPNGPAGGHWISDREWDRRQAAAEGDAA